MKISLSRTGLHCGRHGIAVLLSHQQLCELPIDDDVDDDNGTEVPFSGSCVKWAVFNWQINLHREKSEGVRAEFLIKIAAKQQLQQAKTDCFGSCVFEGWIWVGMSA